jgi:RNA polymerase sigma factor (sigma-70 family)
MDEHEFLAERFEEYRTHLRAVAYRMLGSVSEADDAVQEAWLRLSRADTSDVDNLGGWLTTVVARVALNMLRSRGTRREQPLDDHAFQAAAPRTDTTDPERQAVMADSVGLALLVVLDTLNPAERLAFVLHDMFAVPFEEIAPIVDRSPAATRQLASRARRRVRGQAPALDPVRTRQREVVAAFLAASREGDFDALVALLDPDVVLHADAEGVRAAAAAQRLGAPLVAPELHGADAVARAFSGRAKAARLALIDGRPGATWLLHGEPRAVFAFTVEDGRVTGIDLVYDRNALEGMEVELI